MPKHEFDPEDPLEFVGVAVPGDVRDMAECFIEEFMLMGYSDDRILALFRDPFYQGAHMAYRACGEAGLRALIARVHGVWAG